MRVWGALPYGTTSACAENTINNLRRSTTDGNYLRVRGEYLFKETLDAAGLELPPRARRIPCHAEGVVTAGGTTSACAENTGLYGTPSTANGNYLRVRGEYE